MASFYKEAPDGAAICTLKDGQEVRFFIPEIYFQAKSAIIVGEFVNLLGIFNYAIYDKNDKPISQLKIFNFPSIFLTQPYTITKVKDLKLTKNSDMQDYRVLRYKEGDKLIVQKQVPEDIENVEEFFRLFLITGNIPDTIDYRTIYEYYYEAMALSGNKFNLPPQMFGILQAETCRDPDDISKPFRLSKYKKNHEWDNYKNVSVKALPKYISPEVSLTSENIDDSLMAATLLDDKKVQFSPLERVITGNFREG